MFSLTEIFQSAQGGQASQNLADQFGLSAEQVDEAVKAVIPALSMAFLSKLKDPSSLGSLASALTDGTHTSTFSNPTSAGTPEAAAKGSDILEQIFGSSHILNQISQQAASVTGLRADVIAQMMPVIVSVIAGGLATTLKNQGLGGVFSQIVNGAGQAAAPSGGLGGIIGRIFGGLFGGSAPKAPSGLDSLTKILQPGSKTSVGIEDEIGKILGSGR